jgi:dihydrofolate reductase
MGKLIYSITTSLDGYAADEKDNFEWAKPSEEVHAFVDDILKNVGTFLLGRRMYETLAVWDTIRDTDSNAMNQFAEIWRAAKKTVYSTSLTEVSTANTTIEHVFNAETVHRLITESDKDFGIGGPHLAAEAIRAGIVDEFHQFIVPKIIGGGNYWLPKKVEAELKLVELQKFENGCVHLQYKQVRILPEVGLRS